MKFETKYKIGDKFWLMKDNKAVAYSIYGINVAITAKSFPKFEVFYFNEGEYGSSVSVLEQNVHPTRESLLATI